MVAATLRRYDAGSDQLSFEFKYNLKEKEKLNEIANRNGNVDIEILRRIALWKLDRVLEVSCATLERLQSLATDDHLRANSEATQSLIMELLDCAGVGLPMASTILKFLRPDIFPIIDVRAYRALYGKKVYFSQLSDDRKIELYLQYVSDVGAISQKLNRPLKDIDEQLYEFDRIHNEKI
jgi:hypothetical protein